MRKLNLVFIASLLAAMLVLAGGMHFAHEIQVRRHASVLLERARRAEASQDLSKAADALAQYLNLQKEDGDAWEFFARVIDQREVNPQQRTRVFLAYEKALRYNARHERESQLERRCAELALEPSVGPRYQDAQRHLVRLLDHISDSQGQPVAAEQGAAAELEERLGDCAWGLARYEDAEKRYEAARKHDPKRVSCYDRLARLLRVDLRQVESADRMIKDMVATNPKSGRAYLYRWRYDREFRPPADARDLQKDLQKALELSFDDPEVLLAAATASEQKPGGAAEARSYYEEGRKRDPQNLALALGLAGLEAREKHLDRAEAILRQASQAKPTPWLDFLLAENLIRQDKIDGKDQAEGYITRLRNAGLGNTLVQYLEAEILWKRKKWEEAQERLEMARAAILGAAPDLVAWIRSECAVRLDLMLAECYDHLGWDERRLDALRRASDGDRTLEATRVELAQALARSGKLDQAVTTILPVALRRPEWRLDLVQLLLQKAIRQPRDRQAWVEVDRHLDEAGKALQSSNGLAGEKTFAPALQRLARLKRDVLVARGQDDARSLLAKAQEQDPRNVEYRIALARLTQRQGKGPAALQILDQAEKDLGPSLDLQLARLDHWSQEGGAPARAAVAKLAEMRRQLPAADRAAFLTRLGTVEIRLGEVNLARQYWRELAELQPENLRVKLDLFNLALAAGDQQAAADLEDQIHKAEGAAGTFWRFAQASLLIDTVRRGASQDQKQQDLKKARELADQILERRPGWWVVPGINGEIAELDGHTDLAIEQYTRAVELGNVQPALARKLVGLLYKQEKFDEINRIARMLRDQGAARDDITIVEAVVAIRNRNFDRCIALARQVFPDTSKNSSDHLILGWFYRDAGRNAEAGKEFQRATELGPGVPETWLARVRYLVQTGQSDQARATVEAARQALPADRSSLTLTECFLMLGDTRQAEALVEKALKDEGKSADPATLRLAARVSLLQNPRGDKVEKYLNQLGAAEGASPDDKAWVNRTRISQLLSKGGPTDRNQALRLVEENLINNPESIADQRLRATILADQPDDRSKAEAIANLERLDTANRLGSNEQFLLARLYLNRGAAEKYQAEMQKLLSQKVRSPQHLAHFVNYWIGRNRLDQADRWLAELKQAEPGGFLALALEARLLDLRHQRSALLALLEARGRVVPDQIGAIADLLNRYGFAKEAEAAYKAFIARDPKQPERVLALAGFLAHQDRVPEAMDLFKKAWTTCPPDQVAAAALPVYDAQSASEDQKRQVEAWLVEAVRRRPDSVLLTAKLGIIWVNQGRFDETEALCRRVLASAPDNAAALNTLAWLLSMRDHGNADEAIKLVDRAIQILGASPPLADTRAVAHIKSGRLDQAVEELLAVRRLSPQKSTFALHLAWAYQAKGQTDQARLQLREAERLALKSEALDPLELTVFRRLQKELTPR
jgi:predicted Zn-dependent protease